MNDFSYPASMGRILLMSMEEVLGEDGLSSVLQTADPLIQGIEPGAPSLVSFRHAAEPVQAEKTFSSIAISRLEEALEQVYGPQGGRGMSLRVGRACFQYALREYGTLLGVTTTAFRLLPLALKLKTAAAALAELLNKHTDQHVRVEEWGGSLLWHMDRCPLCWDRHTQEPACHLAVGLAQEALYWLSGGKIFNVEEIACAAVGDPACTLRIDRTPLS